VFAKSVRCGRSGWAPNTQKTKLLWIIFKEQAVETGMGDGAYGWGWWRVRGWWSVVWGSAFTEKRVVVGWAKKRKLKPHGERLGKGGGNGVIGPLSPTPPYPGLCYKRGWDRRYGGWWWWCLPVPAPPAYLRLLTPLLSRIPTPSHSLQPTGRLVTFVRGHSSAVE